MAARPTFSSVVSYMISMEQACTTYKMDVIGPAISVIVVVSYSKVDIILEKNILTRGLPGLWWGHLRFQAVQ